MSNLIMCHIIITRIQHLILIFSSINWEQGNRRKKMWVWGTRR